MAGEKILVVDDEKKVRDTFATAFDEYQIIPVASVEQAWEILSHPNDIDLIVLDVMLPGTKGTEFLIRLKKANPEYKVVIMTGYSSKEIAIEALRSHADEYIEKPFDIQETRELFEKLLQGRRNFAEEGIDNLAGRIRYAQEFIRKNYNKSISLKDISREIFLSPKYFSRVFKEKTGKTFNEYKLSLRIETAKILLKKYSYTVSEIAFKVGYQDPESFMKMFKKFLGFTPSEYRTHNQGIKRY